MILFVEGSERPTGHIIGIYNVQPQPPDKRAASMIAKVISDIEPLHFLGGYTSSDETAVDWKRFLSGDREVLFKSRVVSDYVEIEVLAGSLVVAMRHRAAGGPIEDIREIPTSHM